MTAPTAREAADRARAVVEAALIQHLSGPALSVVRARPWVQCLIGNLATALRAERAAGQEEERAEWFRVEHEVVSHPAHTKAERLGARMVGATRRAELAAALAARGEEA